MVCEWARSIQSVVDCSYINAGPLDHLHMRLLANSFNSIFLAALSDVA
jgi:hypothetical protein